LGSLCGNTRARCFSEKSGFILSNSAQALRAPSERPRWPSRTPGDVFVEPAELTVYISVLRRTLRDGRDGNQLIINVPRRGYSFVGLEKTILRAPADGVVSVIVAEVGENIHAGQPVVAIAETAKQWLSFNAGED
jgi:hypothetical protein